MCQAVQKKLKETGVARYLANPKFSRGHIGVEQPPKPQTSHRSLSVQVIPSKPNSYLWGTQLFRSCFSNRRHRTTKPVKFWGYPICKTGSYDGKYCQETPDFSVNCMNPSPFWEMNPKFHPVPLPPLKELPDGSRPSRSWAACSYSVLLPRELEGLTLTQSILGSSWSETDCHITARKS